MDFQEIIDELSMVDGKIQDLMCDELIDLIGVIEIKDAYVEIESKLKEHEALKDIAKFSGLLSTFSMVLSEPSFSEQVKEILLASNEVLLGLFLKTISGKEAAVAINDLIRSIVEILKKKDENAQESVIAENTQEEVQEEIKEEATISLEEQYGEDYFGGIVEDTKMLNQLADEIREHLDAAQFTLVELEYDDTNEENINRVFRSFHTIKGSSAFLGLRNFEEVGHHMEDLLVLIRDGKLRITKELIDVIFYGIEMLRNLLSIMETDDFDIERMTASFVKVDIFTYIRLITKILQQYTTKKIGEILEEEGKLSKSEVKTILDRQDETQEKFGTIAVEEKMVSEEDVKSAIRKQVSTSKRISYVKVSNERLNMLIDIVGELVINQSMLREIIMQSREDVQEEMKKSDDSAQAEHVIGQLENITTNIKNLVLSMGMVPIAEVFNKLRVVIRNTAGETGKTVIVNITGEETELDRNVVQAIYDPLVHMVRNSVDHGIESPDDREEAGKDRVGNVSVIAEHKGNGIQIIVEDDGKGIDKDVIVEKAIQKGLLEPENADKLTDREIYNFMFLPGFSTAKKVTEVSGRGVGLDVVRKNIEDIHGRVEIDSVLGKYTRFIIRLPLTLAIIEGFVIEIGDNKYVLPFSSIEEIIVPEDNQITNLEDGGKLLYNRGNYIPLIFTNTIFDETKLEEDGQRLAIVISHDNQFFGMLVDRIIGKQEIVVKNLGESLANMNIFSGGTIFGDGTIGFVVDIEGFLEETKKKETKQQKNFESNRIKALEHAKDVKAGKTTDATEAVQDKKEENVAIIEE